MTTLADIQKQIAELQKQAEEIVNNEKANVIAELKEKIAAYNITASELGFRKNSKNAAPTTKTVKYKNEKGETWGGRGPKPQWVKDVEAAGESLDKYLAG